MTSGEIRVGQTWIRAGFSLSLGFLLLITPAPYSCVSTPWCVTAMIQQHVVTTFVFKLGTSSLIQHLVAYRVRKLTFFLSYRTQWFFTISFCPESVELSHFHIHFLQWQAVHTKFYRMVSCLSKTSLKVHHTLSKQLYRRETPMCSTRSPVLWFNPVTF